MSMRFGIVSVVVLSLGIIASACELVVVVWSNPRGGSLSKEGKTALDVVAYGARKVALLPIRLGVYPSPLIRLIQAMVARLS